jgi:hypothetical protein
MGGYPLGYPDIRQDFGRKRTSAPKSAPAGGYPLALADIRQGIAGIRDGYPLTISSLKTYFIISLNCTAFIIPIYGIPIGLMDELHVGHQQLSSIFFPVSHSFCIIFPSSTISFLS